jgi:hypothetical protein
VDLDVRPERHGRHGSRVEGRLYSTPSTSDPDHTDYWADYICVTAPATACIHFPQGMSPVEESSWGNIKSLYR